jgi:5-methyltetrahydrofolate--homocysteine methyltransferase
LGNFLEDVEKKILVYDGSKGHLLQKYGLKGGECPELWNLTHKDIVKEIYSNYKKAGSDVIQTNTFSGNGVQLEQFDLLDRAYELNYESAKLAKEVMGDFGYVAGSIGPTGKLIEPFGELGFNDAYKAFSIQIKALVDGGVDIINFETFTDVAEMRIALLAAKDITKIPIICSVSFEQKGKTLMGTDPKTAVIILKSLGAHMVGTNCSFGPELMVNIVKEMYYAGSGPLSVKPNAGLPEMVNGVSLYKESPEEFSSFVNQFANYGTRLIGGCCGTTPDFVRAIKKKVDILNSSGARSVEKIDFSNVSRLITSAERMVDISHINDNSIKELIPRRDKDIFEQIKSANQDTVTDIILDLILDVGPQDHDIVFINIDNFNETITENELVFSNIVNIIQMYIKQPLIIEACNSRTLDNFLKINRGRAGVIVNEGANNELVNKLKSVVKKYGSLIIDPSLLPEGF